MRVYIGMDSRERDSKSILGLNAGRLHVRQTSVFLGALVRCDKTHSQLWLRMVCLLVHSFQNLFEAEAWAKREALVRAERNAA